MRRDDETLLKAAVVAMQADEPDGEQITASAERVAGRLGIDFVASAIESCGDVAQLLPSYRAGDLPSAR